MIVLRFSFAGRLPAAGRSSNVSATTGCAVRGGSAGADFCPADAGSGSCEDCAWKQPRPAIDRIRSVAANGRLTPAPIEKQFGPSSLLTQIAREGLGRTAGLDGKPPATITGSMIRGGEAHPRLLAAKYSLLAAYRMGKSCTKRESPARRAAVAGACMGGRAGLAGNHTAVHVPVVFTAWRGHKWYPSGIIQK